MLISKRKGVCLALVPIGVTLLFSSCSSGTMVTSGVAYQSIRTTFRQPDARDIPSDAEIILAYTISPDGNLAVGVKNNTDEIMIIDQTMSFFINNGKSTSYYDPTVKTTTITDLASSTEGGSVNLGALGSAFGIGGVLGNVLSGINVGGSETYGTSRTNTTMIIDQPKVSLGPKGSGAMSKTFSIDGIGRSNLKYARGTANNLLKENSYCNFSVCISYSIDGGKNFKKIVTDFYANSRVVVPVTRAGMVNEALRNLYATKTDAINEKLWLLFFNNNVPGAYDAYVHGCLYDFQ